MAYIIVAKGYIRMIVILSIQVHICLQGLVKAFQGLAIVSLVFMYTSKIVVAMPDFELGAWVFRIYLKSFVIILQGFVVATLVEVGVA